METAVSNPELKKKKPDSSKLVINIRKMISQGEFSAGKGLITWYQPPEPK